MKSYVLVESKLSDRVPLIQEIYMEDNGVEYEKEGWTFEEAKEQVVVWLQNKIEEVKEMEE